MLQVYLLINSAFYLLFALWCVLKPKGTSTYLGYDFLNNSGRVEYLSIYTGLEMGFAAFLAICAFLPGLRWAGLIFCVCIYVGVMIVRPVSAIVYGHVGKATYVIGALEYVLGIWGIFLLIQHYKTIH